MHAGFELARDAFAERVHAVGAEQWSLPTPNVGWTVTDLVTHLITEHRWADPLLRGLALADCATAVEQRYQPLAASPLPAEWDEAAATSSVAFRAADALGGRVEINRGWVPAQEYVEEMIFDLVVHAWDLGRAIGYADDLSEELVTAMSPLADAVIDRTPAGMFAAPITVPADASALDRLIARTGRDPATPQIGRGAR